MGSSYQVDLKVKNGCTLKMVFNAMKMMQQEGNTAIDNSVTISYGDNITLTAGFYEDFSEFFDLFMAIIYNDKELIKNHAKNVLSKYMDTGEIPIAITNICKSMAREKHELNNDEIEELYALCKGRIK